MAGLTYDVIVVGAGSAGCVLAARLSEDPARSVLLLEAGQDYPSVATLPADIRSALNPTVSHDWGYTSAPHAEIPAMPLPRAKLVGGCSATNAAFALRGAPSDYDEWAALGNAGWSCRELLPTLRAIESDADFGGEYHGRTGPVPIRRYRSDSLVAEQAAFLHTCAALGYDFVADHNAPDAIGAGPLPMNIVDGVRQSAALTHLAPARSRPNLTIRSGAQVDCVLFDGMRAAGVRLAGSGETLAAGRVILAAGAYGSPTILLRSGVGDPTHLGTLGIPVRVHLPGVGQNLIDHPRLRVRFASRPHPAEVAGCQAVLTLRSRPDRIAQDLQIFPWSTTREGVFVLNAALMKPHSTGSVRLRSTDPAAAPVIDCGFFTDPRDMPRMIHAVRVARAIGRAAPLSAIAGPEVFPGPAVDDSDEALAAVIRSELRTYFHPVGTCRMGRDTDAVVDAHGRVHGAEGLLVVDASIMPTIPAANTNLPTLVVAEHCATMMTREA